VILHLHNEPLASSAEALKVGLMLEIVDLILAVSGSKADDNVTLSHGPKHPKSDLLIVRGDHLDPPRPGLQDRGVVNANAELIGSGGILVGIDSFELEVGFSRASSRNVVMVATAA
jgi:hypothetical protein